MEELFFNDYLLVDTDALSEMGFGPVDGSLISYPELGITDSVYIKDSYLLEYADGDTFVIYNETASTLMAFTRDMTLKPVVIAVPGSRQSQNEAFRDRITRYTALTGRQVELRCYDTENYKDVMSTKIMAQDSDFDLFIADDVLMQNIISKSAYEPLDGYGKIVANFDSVYAKGVKELMTDENGIFGIPLSMHIPGTQKVTDGTSYAKYPTLEDFYDLCDSLEGTGKKALKDRLLLTQMTDNLLDEMLANGGDIDKDTLASFLSKLKAYNDKGVLCDGDKPYVLEFGNQFFIYDSSASYTPVDINTVHAPVAGNTNYIILDETMVLNRSSENMEAAAEFLAFLSSEEVVYGHIITAHFRDLIGRDVEKNREYAKMSEDDKAFAAYSLTLLENSKPTKLSGADSLPEFLRDEIFTPLFDGELSPEKAADKIAKRLSYTLFE